MYATVRSYSGTPDLVDALVEQVDAVRDLITGIEGFQAYYLLRTTAGDAVSISIYDDEAGTAASTREAAAWLRDNVPDLAVGAPQVLSGDVVASF
jgi:heme-degrading monooxygenase HmoA